MEKNMAFLAMTTLCMAFFFYVANASDPSLLQDFCVGVSYHLPPPKPIVFVNGKVCKDPSKVTVHDFLHKGFNISGDTSRTPQKVNATLVDVNKFPALNTLGVSIARVDFEIGGLNTPHLHHRSSEVFAVMEGTLYAGFVTSNNKLFGTRLNKGDIIAFPQGLVHFQMNIGFTKAYAIAAFGSQNPGRIDLPNSVFGTKPEMNDRVLTEAFQVPKYVIKKLKAQFNDGIAYE